MCQREGNPPRIHDLVQLLNVCILYDTHMVALAEMVQVLNPYGILVRYPGLSTTQADSKEALNAARRIRKRLRAALGYSA